MKIHLPDGFFRQKFIPCGSGFQPRFDGGPREFIAVKNRSHNRLSYVFPAFFPDYPHPDDFKLLN
jgi:hypothetical protein